MKQAWNSGALPETWSARYEQLRAGWLAHELTWGQALFIRQGMTAWMKAWPTAVPSEATIPLVAESDALPSVAMGGELQRQLARELAYLILHRQQEVVA